MREYANTVCGVDVSKEPLGKLPDMETVDAVLKHLSRLKKSENEIMTNHGRTGRDEENTTDRGHSGRDGEENATNHGGPGRDGDGNATQHSRPDGDGASPTQPLFLAVGFHKPHIPLKFPREFSDLYPLDSIQLPDLRSRTKPADLPDVAWNPWNDIRRRDDVAAAHPAFPFGPLLPDDYQRRVRQSYFSSISYVDDLFGKLMSGIEDRFPEFFSNSIVVFTSDHGWSLGEHGEWSKYSNYEIATRVPLMVYDSDLHDYQGHANSEMKNESLTRFAYRNPLDLLDERTAGNAEKSFAYRRSDRVPTEIFRRLDRVPTESYRRSDRVVELVDLFPTLAELVVEEKVPSCPVSTKARLIPTCAEGDSFASLMAINNLDYNNSDSDSDFDLYSDFSNFSQSSSFTIKTALSQFPRPGPMPTKVPDSDQPKMSEIRVMGYSIRWLQFRYAEWIGFDNETLRPDFSEVFGKELYDHSRDANEDDNVSGMFEYSGIEEYLSSLLRQRTIWQT